jgi:hypothetical protein
VSVVALVSISKEFGLGRGMRGAKKREGRRWAPPSLQLTYTYYTRIVAIVLGFYVIYKAFSLLF